jgi:hypothetical protein
MSDFAHLDGTFSVSGGGTITARPLLGGVANVAEVRVPGGPNGVSLKVREAETGIWSVWWLPAADGVLGPPRRGRWVDGAAWLAGAEPDGSLWAYALRGLHWEQHRSTDGGRSWAVESTMDMNRQGPVVDPPPAGDFGFLARTLSVAHRRRSRTGEGAETFTSSHTGTTCLDGMVSVDEVGLTDGRTGMTFRARDATGVWSIWWIDSSRGRLEPPVRGRFGPDGVGTFVGAEDDLLVRFTWSDVDSEHPRWRQDLSTDGARTWDTDWEMTFS